MESLLFHQNGYSSNFYLCSNVLIIIYQCTRRYMWPQVCSIQIVFVFASLLMYFGQYSHTSNKRLQKHIICVYYYLVSSLSSKFTSDWLDWNCSIKYKMYMSGRKYGIHFNHIRPICFILYCSVCAFSNISSKCRPNKGRTQHVEYEFKSRKCHKS